MRRFAAGERVFEETSRAEKSKISENFLFRALSRSLVPLFALVFAAAFLIPAASRAQTTTETHRHHHARHTSKKKVPSNDHAAHRVGGVPTHTAARRRTVAATRRRHYRRPHHLTARERARSLRLRRAFVASSELRPMAQQ
ncbi:MAG: hypothetical protein WBG54_13020, partial [Acidobacteriaceae bacterium]